MKEEQMTNKELDAACCEFAGLEPEYWTAGIKWQSICIVDPEWFRKDYEANPGKYWTKDPIPKWPSVSTDWGAAGRLMDALILKGVLYEADGDGADGYEFKHSISLWYSKNLGVEARERVDATANTFPMALCLAVAAIAAASDKEAGR